MRIVRWYASEAAARAAERRHIERANPVGNNSWNIARRLARAEAAYAKALDDYGIAFSADDADRPALNVKYQAKLNAISKRIAHCREVAVACKVSATTVYNHFPAREQEKLRKLGPTKRKN